MRATKALAELRSLERRKRRNIDDESVPFLACLRTRGALNDKEWMELQVAMSDAIAFLRRRARKPGGPLEEGPLDADWIRIVRTCRLTGHRLPGWATLWLRRSHPDSDVRFWRKVARIAAELGLPPVE